MDIAITPDVIEEFVIESPAAFNENDFYLTPTTHSL